MKKLRTETFIINQQKRLFANYLFTTLTGLPSRNAVRFVTVICINLALASLVAHAICGVIIQFFASKRGLPVEVVQLTTHQCPHLQSRHYSMHLPDPHQQ
jgi:hypothetical protein